ncbi:MULTISPECIES: glycosyltransferase family 1 protein [unclassified Colwellia]|uniref:glycosyltransferase family 4 protein n=1 Tax=unclassified Colwellia TaxID=196834 RepID=UPI0015F507EC|nr:MULTISPECIES: glycosyltransferase family 1 protein [unclassified Colwellia]MBA6381220.1 glycosyltransferase family 4 protein [Colwellia sp. BRX10-7]MBA6388929.1 glycosyltransferase family 4 protein [Colwellia sp. BRX10-2]MBA6400000.1 glycosyltransferase family 4 protein [Colwellia sp. BRX10-5]MBA6403879.1 glycosyltransferase family 4 protein [Colwellia sp. BRX10-1]
MKYIFSSPYYLNKRATGANKRFERVLYELQDKYDIGIVVAKGEVPLDVSPSVTLYEIPLFIANRRLLTFIYLNILYLYFSLFKNILISDFNPIPVSMFFSKRQFQLIHDTRIFDNFGRWDKLSSMFMKFQWKHVKNKVVVSQFTKDRLCKELSIKESSVIVSYNGVLPSDFDVSLNKDKAIDLLYVATFEERKNHINLIRALANIEERLIVTFLGKDLGMKAVIEEEASKADRHQITFLDSVSENELADLYQNSKIFISPSLYEGFGMPILEAYAYGCKVICSDIFVFHEVLGSKATYFNAEEVSSISRTIEESLSSFSNFKDQKVIVPNHFHWEVISEQLISDIDSLLFKKV